MNRPTIVNPTSMFSPDLAEKKAAELRAGDPDWTYVVNHAPNGDGLSTISVYDEDGEFVAKV